MPTLSIVIVTKNETLNIVDCIKSAQFADEVLVLDSGSSDDTVKLAALTGARVIETDWPGFGPQKNRAIDASTGEWIFSLDADERITDTLKNEILIAINANTYDVFDVPRRSLFVSRFMQYSGWRPDRTNRLFKRTAARFTDNQVHEHLKTNVKVGHLTESIVHYSYRDVDTVLKKMNHYSSAGAQDLKAKGKQGSLFSAMTHGVWAFIRTYIIKLGFLDGAEGFILAIANAETTYYKYLKLYFLNRPSFNEQPENSRDSV
jgi:glycosyltransferase involved in cell wall biosynthesis